MTSQASPDQFVALYTRHERQLYRYVATLLPRPFDVDDVMQETARVLWQKFAEYRPDKPFLQWAKAVAMYEVLNYRQRERTRRKYFSKAVIESLAATRDEHDELLEAQSAALKNCMEKLPDDERVLVEQRYTSDEPMKEIARRCGCTANSLYKALQRVRRTLMHCIDRTLLQQGWK